VKRTPTEAFFLLLNQVGYQPACGALFLVESFPFSEAELLDSSLNV
jgi:hypothetical protein